MKLANTVRYAMLAASMSAAGVLSSQAADIQVTADITADTTWTANNVYFLTKPIFVKDGAILTVNAGTVIRGKKEVSTDPGALIVSRGSKIRAMGTAAAPIVMTDTNDMNFGSNTGSGPYFTANNGITRKWGGLILLGRSYIATNVGEPGTPSPDASLEFQIEGLDSYGTYSRYGGGNDDDDSGELHYISIRYGGFVLGVNNEINGLTMGCVGRETDIDHIEVFQNKDDGYEWFGGTVNTKYLVSWCNADDSFDWDEGFRGKGQFWLAVQGPLATENDVSDKAAEMDGAIGDASQPSACPTIYNATLIGTGKSSDNKNNTALHFRDGTGGRWYNSMVMDFGGATALIEGDPSNSTYDSADMCNRNYVNDSYYTHNADGGKMLQILNGLFWKFGTNGAFACPVNSTQMATLWGASGTDGNKAHYGYPMFTDATLKNTLLPDSSPAPVATFSRSATPVAIGTKNYYPINGLNPTLNTATYGSVLMTAGRIPPKDGFFTPVSFVGAFANQRNWAAPWTLGARMGLNFSAASGSYTGVVPDVKAEGLDANVVIAQASTLDVTIGLTADVYAGISADWWVIVDGGTLGFFYYNLSSNSWVPGIAKTYSGALFDLAPFSVLSAAGLPTGNYVFYFGVDTKPNSVLDFDALYVDAVNVTIN